MRQFIDIMNRVTLSEGYMGTYRVECDYGGIETVEAFRNPSRSELAKEMRASEYASVRASLYSEDNDTLIMWVGDRVQHHDMDYALNGPGSRFYIRLFFDNTGVSMNSTGEEEADEEFMQIVKASTAMQRLFGKDFEIEIP